VESSLIAARWPATWGDVAFVREVWKGPLLLKGILRPDECDRIVDLGVDGVVVSNHGGRQLDGAPATITALPEIVAAIDKRAEVFLDGGVRRGTDVVKALALGATACLEGRPYLYALAAGGSRGLVRMFDILRTEIDRAMALLGCRVIEDIDHTLVSVVPTRCRSPKCQEDTLGHCPQDRN
jgi:isopentenyl diphosphate isomerase/L-lactate dehydrogenase-like FMN-dependent dehydrogenase